MKPLRIATALAMLATPAYASGGKISTDAIKACEQEKLITSKVNRKQCIRDLHEDVGFTLADAKHLCDPKNSVPCNKLGWSCDGGAQNPIIKKNMPGGRKTRHDVTCE